MAAMDRSTRDYLGGNTGLQMKTAEEQDSIVLRDSQGRDSIASRMVAGAGGERSSGERRGSTCGESVRLARSESEAAESSYGPTEDMLQRVLQMEEELPFEASARLRSWDLDLFDGLATPYHEVGGTGGPEELVAMSHDMFRDLGLPQHFGIPVKAMENFFWEVAVDSIAFTHLTQRLTPHIPH